MIACQLPWAITPAKGDGLLLFVRGGKVSGIRWRARSVLEAGVTMR